MGIQVESAQNGNVLVVDETGRALVESKSNLRGFFISRDDARLFNIVFNDASAAAGDFVGYVKNTSQSRILVVDLVRVEATEAAVWNVHKVSGVAVGAAAAPLPVNMNFGSGLLAEAEVAVDAITGLTSEGLVASDRHLAASSSVIPFDDTLILPPDTAFAIQYLTGTTGEAAITARLYYEPLN